MSIRLPKVPLIIAALLAVLAAAMYFLAPIFSPDFNIAGISSDLLGIGIFGVGFLVFALSFALATPVEKKQKDAKKSNVVEETSAVIMGDFVEEEYTRDSSDLKREAKLDVKAEKAAKIILAKSIKQAAIDSKKESRAEALAEKKSLADEAAARKKAIKDSKEAERKSRYEDDDDSPAIEYISGEEFAAPLTKEQRDALKEEDELAKKRAKDESDFSRGAKKQAAIAAKLKLAEEKTKAKEEALAAKEKAKLDKAQAKLDKKALKSNKNIVEAVEEEDAIEEVEELTTSAEEPTEEIEKVEEVEDVVESEDLYASFNAPQLSIPSAEDIYSSRTFVIPFSSPITSREGKALQAEMFKRIAELNDKVDSLEAELASLRGENEPLMIACED
jgi:hypothetical protein